MKGAGAHVPLHITGFWAPRRTPDPASTGSIGAGLVLEPGVTVKLRICGRSVTALNGAEVELRPLDILLDSWGVEACVEAWSPVPIGAGYAVSAAVTLGAAASLALVTGRSLGDAYRSAHIAEVKASTGLGDVAAIVMGGYLEVRTKPGAPGIGSVEILPLDSDLRVVTAPLGREETSEMLSRIPGKAYEQASKGVEELLSTPSLDVFAWHAAGFSRAAGMMEGEIGELLSEACRGCPGFFVKKRVAVLLAWRAGAWRAAALLEEKLGVEPIVLKASRGGVTVFSLG